MSQAEELLTALADEGTEVVTESGNIVVDSDRFVVVPDSLKKIGVQYDHNVETVTFDCPRYWDGRDLSTMRVYISYMRSDGMLGMQLCENVTVDSADENLMHFDWVITENVTQVAGYISFLVCIKKVDSDGIEINHWNSELNTEMYVAEGLKCQETLIRRYPDIITQLLLRQDHVEEVMDGIVKDGVHYHDNKEVLDGITKAIVTIDPTLSQIGSPADAATTGEKVKALNDELVRTNARIDKSNEAIEKVNDDLINGLNTKSNTDHTHSYAGSSTVGGSANSAEKLNSDAGGIYKPVYFENGVPLECDMSRTFLTTLTTNWEGSGAPFTQTIAVDGILEIDNPIVYPAFTGVYTEDLDIIAAWSSVSRITTADGSITVTCFLEKPETEIPIQLKVVR